MDSQTFLSQVRDHGFLNEEQWAAVSQRFGPEAPLHDLTTALVDKGWLTPYQVERIWAGKAKGLVLGQYRILAELGRGGFGCVYKARHLIMNRVVALKVISPELVDDSRARSWFRREVLATTQLHHPNIVMAYDANEVDDVLFLVMEYVEGPNLAEVVGKQGPLPIGLACALMLQAARALQYADERGMVHRDIKPANLLLDGSAVSNQGSGVIGRGSAGGQAAPLPFLTPNSCLPTPVLKIVDFGLARLQSHGSVNTLMGLKERNFVGTPDYVSPEQARNIHEVDIRADLYSLGCTFFFALTGRPPFKGKNPLDIVLQHLEQEPLSVDRLRPEVPPALASIVRRLMAKKPEQRFPTPADLAAELSFFFGSGALQAAPPAGAAAAPGPAFDKPRFPPLQAGNDPPGTQLPALPLPTSLKPNVAVTDQQAEQDLPRTMIVATADPALAAGQPNSPAASAGRVDDPALSLSLDAVASADRVAPTVQQQLEVDGGGDEPRFSDHWRQWLAVIEDLVQGRAPAISEAEYSDLHGALLTAVRSQARRAHAHAVFPFIESILEPWLTLDILARTDRTTLASLFERCCQLEQELGLRRPARGLGRWAVVTLVFVLAALLGAFWIANGGSATQFSFSLSTLWRLMTANATLTLILAVPPFVLASVYLIMRLSRS